MPELCTDNSVRRVVFSPILILQAMKNKGRGDTKEAVADTVVKNVAQMRETGKPVSGAKPRDYMPQMDDDGRAKALLTKAVIDLT